MEAKAIVTCSSLTVFGDEQGYGYWPEWRERQGWGRRAEGSGHGGHLIAAVRSLEFFLTVKLGWGFLFINKYTAFCAFV